MSKTTVEIDIVAFLFYMYRRVCVSIKLDAYEKLRNNSRSGTTHMPCMSQISQVNERYLGNKKSSRYINIWMARMSFTLAASGAKVSACRSDALSILSSSYIGGRNSYK